MHIQRKPMANPSSAKIIVAGFDQLVGNLLAQDRDFLYDRGAFWQNRLNTGSRPGLISAF